MAKRRSSKQYQGSRLFNSEYVVCIYFNAIFGVWTSDLKLKSAIRSSVEVWCSTFKILWSTDNLRLLRLSSSDFYFPFLLGLLLPFSIWTFISLLYLDISFSFNFFVLTRFNSIAVTFWISSNFFYYNVINFLSLLL